MPELVKLGVNYRVALHNSLDEIQETSVKHIRPIVDKYGLTLRAFEDENLEHVPGPADENRGAVPLYEVDYNGTLVLRSTQRTLAAPISPTHGPVWDLFSGTIQHTFAFENGTVVPVGEIMGGNTDTRHYQGKPATPLRPRDGANESQDFPTTSTALCPSARAGAGISTPSTSGSTCEATWKR